MPFLKWMNEYRVAILLGLVAGSLYVYFSWDSLNQLNFANTVAGIAVGTIFATACAFLLWQISEPNVYLGVLQDERKTLLAGLTYTIVLSLIWLIQLFNGLPIFPTSERQPPAEWLFHNWGIASDEGLDCETALILRRGRDDGHILFVTGSDAFHLQIADTPTHDMVATDEGTFTLKKDDTMRYDQMENKTFTRCDR